MKLPDISVRKVDVSAYTIPTDADEGDGTLRWDSTTLIVCEIHAASQIGLGYTYGNKATASVADQLAAKCLLHRSALDIPGLHASMLYQIRNDGSRGIASMAISALDVALWDLKAKAVGFLPCRSLWGSSCKGNGLQKWRIHHLQQPAVGCATVRLGRRRSEECKDEDRRGAGCRLGEGSHGTRSDRTIHEFVCGREW